jgi:hypothetical protein
VIDIVLRPWPQVKLSNEKILHWDQDSDLISEGQLERIPAIRQCGTHFLGHVVALLPRVAGAEVVPQAQADRVDVLVRLDADPAPSLSDMLDGSPAIQMATQQAGQAAAEYLDCL